MTVNKEEAYKKVNAIEYIKHQTKNSLGSDVLSVPDNNFVFPADERLDNHIGNSVPEGPGVHTMGLLREKHCS